MKQRKGQVGGTTLKQWAFAALLISTITIGLTGFISDGLTTYNVANNVDQSQLERLEKIENATRIADEAQQRAEAAQAKSNFFTLPKIVSLLRLPFDAIPLFSTFASVSIDVLGLGYAAQNWPLSLFTGFVTLSIAFAFARRVL